MLTERGSLDEPSTHRGILKCYEARRSTAALALLPRLRREDGDRLAVESPTMDAALSSALRLAAMA